MKKRKRKKKKRQSLIASNYLQSFSHSLEASEISVPHGIRQFKALPSLPSFTLFMFQFKPGVDKTKLGAGGQVGILGQKSRFRVPFILELPQPPPRAHMASWGVISASSMK